MTIKLGSLDKLSRIGNIVYTNEAVQIHKDMNINCNLRLIKPSRPGRKN
jgi:hypothetical protein